MHPDLIQEFNLEGRVAVITGAASGIGREAARVLAQAGAQVVLADVNEAGLEETKGLVTQLGGKALVRRTNVSQRADMDALADAAVREFGRLDIWFNAAGILRNAMITDVDEAQFEEIFGVNLKGTYWGCAAAARTMKAQGRGGAIVNVASAAMDMPAPNLSLYAMTKAGVAMLTRNAAKEFGPLGIRVNAIAPGWIETPMVAYRFSDAEGQIDEAKRQETVKQMGMGSPLGLTGKPRDIALAMLYLVSDASRFVTGQVVRPNGGVAMP
jgi:3-oxoacyl-[acyl-carrier protein] reductase